MLPGEEPKQVPFELLRMVMVDLDVVEAVALRVLQYTHDAGYIAFCEPVHDSVALTHAVQGFMASVKG